jgi:hypothetical protein
MDFEKARGCNFNRQCEFIPYGHSGCGGIAGNYQGYFIYSTKIGSENLRYLKVAIAQDRHYKIENEPPLWECTMIVTAKPNPMCKNHTCIDGNEKDI